MPTHTFSLQVIVNVIKYVLLPFLQQHRSPEFKPRMNMKKVAEDFYVSGQIGFADLANLAETGIKSIICARPDDEDRNQPLFAELAVVAEKHGIVMLNVPILPGQAGKADVDKFAQGYFSIPKPILGYCRSGARAHSLWELNQEATAMRVPMGN